MQSAVVTVAHLNDDESRNLVANILLVEDSASVMELDLREQLEEKNAVIRDLSAKQQQQQPQQQQLDHSREESSVLVEQHASVKDEHASTKTNNGDSAVLHARRKRYGHALATLS